MIGIFNTRVLLYRNADGVLEVELDGPSDAAGFGEALGFAASCWLDSTPPEDRARDFAVMLGAFVTLARQSRAGVVRGTVDVIDTGGHYPPGGRVS